jgi:hypothetical protein
MHEFLHQPLMHREPDWYGAATNDQRLWEEAAAEQGANDLLPAAARQLFGHVARPAGPDVPVGLKVKMRKPKARVNPAVADRAERERAYQQLSVFGSGAKRYEDRAARQWRRAFLNASTTDRQRMESEALAMRGAR